MRKTGLALWGCFVLVSLLCSNAGATLVGVSTNDASFFQRRADNGNDRWEIVPVDTMGDVGCYLDIAVGEGEVFISYYDMNREDLKVAWKTADGWQRDVIDAAGSTGKYSSVAVDEYGVLHVSYFDESNMDLKYATRDEQGWQVETVDSEGNVGFDTSVAVDSHNQPHISYNDRGNGYLKHAVKVGGT